MAVIREKTLKFPGLDNVYTFADEADLFDANVPCSAGEYRIYEGELYRCDADHTGAWNYAHFTPVKLGNEVSTALASAVGQFQQKTIEDVAIATFDDGGDNVPVKSLIVSVDPVQSGSGDPSPENMRIINGWAACNLFDTNANMFDPSDIKCGADSNYNLSVGSTLKVAKSVSNVSVSGTNPIQITNTANWRGVVLFSKPIKKGTSVRLRYRISGTANADIKRSMYLVDNSGKILSVINTASAVTESSSYVYSYWHTYSEGDNLMVAFAIESASTQTVSVYDVGFYIQGQNDSFSEYYPPVAETIPIRFPTFGKNLFYKSLVTSIYAGVLNDNGVWSSSTYSGYTDPVIAVQPSTQYVMSGDITEWGSGTAAGYRVYYYDADKNFIGRSANLRSSADASNSPFTTPSNCRYLAIQCQRSNNYPKLDTIQLELGSTVTSYEPYIPVYGATIDLVRNKLIVDTAMLINNTADMDNSNDYPGWRSSGLKALGITGEGVAHNAVMNVGNEYSYNCNSSNDILFLSTNTYQKDQDAWKALAIDVQVLVTLPTPIEYDLTDVPTITTLLGLNNIWADAGDIDELIYRTMNNTDAKIRLTKALIAPVLDDMVADTLLAANDFRVVGDTLYIITGSVASGSDLIPGTNCTATTIGEQITALLNA